MADGTEIVTLSNLASSLNINPVATSTVDGTELVTLSNLKAALTKHNSSSGGPSILNKTWAEINAMSAELSTLGETAFKEKYSSYLGSLVPFTFFGFQKSRISYDMVSSSFAMLIGLAHDIDANGNKIGFTFLILSPLTGKTIRDISNMGYDYQNLRNYCVLAYDSVEYEDNYFPYWSYLKSVRKMYGEVMFTDKFFFLSPKEVGAVKSLSELEKNGSSDNYATYEFYPDNDYDHVYEAFSNNDNVMVHNILAQIATSSRLSASGSTDYEYLISRDGIKRYYDGGGYDEDRQVCIKLDVANGGYNYIEPITYRYSVKKTAASAAFRLFVGGFCI